MQISDRYERGQINRLFLMHGTNISGLAKEFKLTQEEIKNFVGNNERICVAKSLALQRNSEKEV